ncbi:BEL1-like homeodomain protein 9 [Durio zibethinus]|uniref:BEL1-like homeodomain protein 9 n=1 Tax=Durio zibethinus TaxID=66656 RepID=A0A6P6AI27_DURZI|nr:BEL1-like homeodomain protein 9 [Durio zibethinus]
MAQNNELIHIPQQNRRNRLRVTTIGTNPEEQTSQSSLLQLNQPALLSSSRQPTIMHTFPQMQNPRDINYQFFNGQGLSLSLSFQHQDNMNLPLNLDAQKGNGNSILGGFVKQNGQMRSSLPLGPFTGYASVLNSSRFLKPAQQILDDFVGVDYRVLDFPLESFGDAGVGEDPISCSGRIQHRWKNSRLILILDEVYRKYKLYCQQIQSVVASFKCVSGLGNAAPYVCFAFKAIAKHFSCLKNAILDQIRFTEKTIDNVPTSNQGLNNQNPIQNLTFLQHPLWRSQRGLPDHAVAVLKTWLFEHFLHPYPTDSEKLMLARQTGLSRTQVSNWFINARVRLWKPMVEEIHMLELRQARTLSSEATTNQDAKLPSELLLDKLPHFTANTEVQNIQTKRPRNNMLYADKETELQKSVSYTNQQPSNHHQLQLGGTSNFCLELGLNQNNGIDLTQSLPINLCHNLNFETDGDQLSLKAGFDGGRQHHGKNF